MDPSLLRTFLAVYRAGSFSAAAPVLGRSQPTVTTQIRALESQLGQQLFQRLPRGVAPTSVAHDLARRTARHLDALEAITEPGAPPGSPLGTPVHLGGPAEFTTSRILPALTGLVDQGLRLRVTFGLADDLLDGLRQRRFDMVVSTIRPRGRATAATALTDEEFVLVGAPQWTDRLGGDTFADDPLAALHDVPLVAFAEDLPIIRRYWRTVFGGRPAGTAAVVVPDLRGVLACVLAGTGITVLPSYLCAAELARGDLALLHDPVLPPINTLYLATRPGTGELPHLAAVHDQLRVAARDW